MGNQQQNIYKCIENRSSRRHEQSTLIPKISSPGCKSPNYKVGMNMGDDSVDDFNQSSFSEVVSEDDEPWAVRFAEMFRIEVA